MAGPPQLPFFRSPTVQLFDLNRTLRVVMGGQIKLAFQTWRLVDTSAKDGALILHGAFFGTDGDVARRELGGIAPADAAVASDALAKRFDLPKPLTVVDYAELERNPRTYHLRHVEAVGLWSRGFEQSSFAGAWMSGPLAATAESGSYEGQAVNVRARGVWQCDVDGMYGHLGGSDAAFTVYDVVPV